ncbi:hypothetical protein FACS189461_2610 [Spirochaetia bacterium]|nr:hypothetical protein FACS189461_2610 [Spirochaetia bacterium]
MAKGLSQCLAEFMAKKVNLNPERVQLANASKENLIENILSFSNDDFFGIYSEKNIQFGSFARKTKIHPIDDIDLMICLNADESTYFDNYGEIKISINHSKSFQNHCLFEGTNQLNSTRVINQFIGKLENLKDYKKAELHKRGESVTLHLQSYEWNFDIVPCFFTTPESDGKTYYIIPDGSGYWKKTDPRIDRQNIIELNKATGGLVFEPIRLVKFWNKRPTMPSMPSYALECLLVEYFSRQRTINKNLFIRFQDCLRYIYHNINSAIVDPKMIQGDLNELGYEERQSIKERALVDYQKIENIRRNIDNIDYCNIRLTEIFGNEFPQMG